MDLNKYIAVINGYPKPGISFKDVTPLIANPEAFNYTCEQFVDFAKEVNANVIVGPEARGFIFGCPVATNLGLGFAPIRKPGKLPRETISYKYDLEYGSDKLEISTDAIKPGQKAIIMDDLMATGGTVGAAIELIEKLGAKVPKVAFLMELKELKGKDKLPQNIEVISMLKY